ncbi:MAG: hypothetical protein ABI318_01555 [Chthoniobacteraceae bacterium]
MTGTRAARQLLQERATTRKVDAKAVALLKEQVAGSDVPQVLRAVWTLHVIGALDAGQLANLTKHQSDIVRGWAVQLSKERAGKPLLGADVFVSLAKNDPSPSVPLALAYAVPTPAAWPQARARFAKSGDAALGSIADQLSAIFGDKAVLAKMRGILADEKAPLPQRQFPFDLLKRGNDPEAVPIFARLLDVDAFRATVIPLLSRSNDPAIAEALIQRFEKFAPTERSAALGTLTSRAQLALPLLRAVKSGKFDRKRGRRQAK